ncbi:hypothetical protein ACQ4LE_000280 [Meloidogyne hapla]
MENDEYYVMKGMLVFGAAGLSRYEKLMAKTLLNNSAALLNNASYQNAIKTFNNCRVKSIECLYYLANCYSKDKKKEDAERYYNQLIKKPASNEYEREIIAYAREEVNKLRKK